MQLPTPDPVAPSTRDLNACRRLLANGSRTFFAASFLLPRRIREPATALYAFCRLADDAIDGRGGNPAVLLDLMQRLQAAYDGNPADYPADRAFSAVVRRYQIPIALPEALLEGFAWDAEGRRYETIEDLEAYAARVAGTVGAMMAVLMGGRDEAILARACDLGIAMQLTNIARDVGEDAATGRLYLPLSWMRQVGIDPHLWLTAPVFTPALGSVIDRLLFAADQLYKRSESGIARLPADCQPGIRAARILYAEIGHELTRQGLDSVTQRAVVTPGRKLRLLSQAMRHSQWSAAHFHAGPVPGAAHLVRAGAAPRSQSDATVSTPPPWWNMQARFIRIIEIFERLERADREAARARPLRTQTRIEPASV